MIQGYKRATPTIPRHVVMSVEALQKRGKSTFALTAPSPICMIDLNADAEDIINKILEIGDKEIQLAQFNFTLIDQAAAKKRWEEVEKVYYNALKASLKEIKSVVLDDGTSAWELLRFAEFGRLAGEIQRNYAYVNSVMKRMIQEAKMSDKNVIWTHRLADEYGPAVTSSGKATEAKTGRMVLAGFKGVPYDMPTLIRLWRRPKDRVNKKLLVQDEEYGLTILECRPNSSLIGMEYTEPLNTFQMVATDIYPDLDPSYWED